MGRGAHLWATLLGGLAAACNLEGGASLDGALSTSDALDAHEGSTDVRGSDSTASDGLEAGFPDAEEDLGAGALTMVADFLELIAERRCDHDGDGQMDNALADLGASASVVTAALNGTLLAEIGERSRLMVFHFPLVDDLNGPTDDDATVITVHGIDQDSPPVREDDFSGHEPFAAAGNTLDGCGEPRASFVGATLDRGELDASGGTIPIPIESYAIAEGARLWGRIAPGGRGAELELCGYVTLTGMGDEEYPGPGGISLLEFILAGGAAAGVPTVPGLLPNVDLDGDGTERFELDDDGLISACIDGDLTRIPGRECWRDERMADAFGLDVSLTTVGAVFEGRAEGWEQLAQGPCETPPEESLFDPR